MPNSVDFFAINADDVPRARRFYETVFGWTFEPWGPPGFYLIETEQQAGAIRGALQERRDQQTRVRRWDRKQVGGTLHVKVAEEQARIVDMSYGGVRLAFSDEAHIPMRFEIELPSSGVPVKAHRVWTAPASADQFLCGVELDEATMHWRDFVNRAAARLDQLPNSPWKKSLLVC